MPHDSIDMLAAVPDLAPSISARSAEIELERRLPLDLLDQLIAAGCFRMLTPRGHGGLEVDLPLSVEIIETIAAADGATGWTVMIGSESAMLLALLPRSRFDRIYANTPNVIVGGGFAPRGQAAAGAGGYLVNGRWAFVSGCQHSRFLSVNSVVAENGRPRPGLVPGSNDIRAMLFRSDQVTIIDTWEVIGLRGTGSHDIEVKDLQVPSDDSLDIFMGQSCVPGVLYKAPVVSFALHIGAVGRESPGRRSLTSSRWYRPTRNVSTPAPRLPTHRYSTIDSPRQRRACAPRANCSWRNRARCGNRHSPDAPHAGGDGARGGQRGMGGWPKLPPR